MPYSTIRSFFARAIALFAVAALAPACSQLDGLWRWSLPQDEAHSRGLTPYMKRHMAFVEQARNSNIRLLFIGDSITEYWQSDVKAGWNHEYVPLGAANFGISGDTTRGVLWRVRHGEIDRLDPAVTILLIGTNDISMGQDTPVEIAARIKKIIDVLIESMPKTKVILLAVFPRDAQAQAPVRKIVSTINVELAKFDNGDSVRYLDIGEKFLDAGGNISTSLMPDGLHLSEAAYKIWAEAMRPLLHKLGAI